MKTLSFMIFIALVVISIGAISAFAQSNDILLSMQKDVYYPNDVITINGTTSSNQLVIVQIKNPFDKTVYEKSLLPTEKGQFSISYVVDSYPTKGTYVVLVTQNLETAASYFGVYSKPSIRLEASLDKINYQNTDQPRITILDLSESVIDVKIFDNSQVQQFEDKIKTSSKGNATYVLNITSYPVGVYDMQVTSSTGQQKAGFSVGMPNMGSKINVNTEKNTYLLGDYIAILGTGNANALVELSLIDPDGISVASVQTFSDNTGHFSTHNLKIPQDGVPGIWHVDAASGVNHETIEVKVILSELTAVQNSTNASIPTYFKSSGPVVITITSASSPLQQFKSGTLVQDIKCDQDFQLIVKSEDGSPVCVKPDTAQKLIERGWAKEIVSANHPTATQMKLKVYGFVCCGLEGDLLQGYLSTSTNFVSNATVQISINGIVMGHAKTYSDGCFQFNQWNESKLAEQTNAFLANEKKFGVYKPFNLTFTAYFVGDKNHDPVTTQTSSAMSLTAIPIPPPQLETTLRPPQVNLTQGSSSNFQVSVRPMVEQWNIPHLNLYLEGYPCETYFRLSQSSDNNTASTTHPALFDGTMSASTDSPEGKYFVHMMQNGANHLVANDIGTFPLNVTKMK